MVKAPKKVSLYLYNLPWSFRDKKDQARAIATVVPGCMRASNANGYDRMSVKPYQLDGALAEAWLVQRYTKDGLPDYSKVERIFTAGLIDGTVTLQYKAQFLLLSFAECVFRNDKSHTWQLFQTVPLSNEETAAFASLEPMLSACAPNNPGEQTKFSRLQLRGLLAEAAYEIDRMYRGGTR